MAPSPQKIEATFREIEAAAVLGARAPKNAKHVTGGTIDGGTLNKLTTARRVRTEVYAKNWRVFQILTGPHAGKRTQECPWGGQPYKILPNPHSTKG